MIQNDVIGPRNSKKLTEAFQVSLKAIYPSSKLLHVLKYIIPR